MSVVSAAAACAAVGFALGGGYSAWMCFERIRRKIRHRSRLLEDQHVLTAAPRPADSALDVRVIAFLERESIATHAKRLPDPLMRTRWFPSHIECTGLAAHITREGFCIARIKLAAIAGVVGFVLGLCASVELGIVLALVGIILGTTSARRALTHRSDWRAQEMERHLPEMLDVVAIGMRSGLSFDRSLKIYAARFHTILAQEFATAEREWESGLERRADALRNLARTYDSPILARVIESIIRSVRFGTSMVQELEDAAREARTSYRTKRQIQIAKAPVKMMVPTGTLILPAMLILVLGPVLLEMAGRGI